MGRKQVNFGKGKRSPKLVGKNGQYNTQNKKNVDKLEKAINARTDLTDALYDSFRFHTDYEIVTKKQMKKEQERLKLRT